VDIVQAQALEPRLFHAKNCDAPANKLFLLKSLISGGNGF
jgi:hypothetical protein